jgi:hypothetical protein
MADAHVAPDVLQGQRVALHRHVAGLRERQLQHKAAAVVGDAPHHIQPPRRARHEYVILSAMADRPFGKTRIRQDRYRCAP